MAVNIYLISSICLFLVVVGLLKMVVDTKKGKKSIFYYNADPITHCPKCGHSTMESSHFPSTFRQVFFGDWVCKKCGKAFTRFGDEIEH